MTNQKLQVIPTITEAIQLGIKNVAPLILTVILYVITVWIPYLNVGTTIGLYRIIINMTKGKVINPLSIFDKDNFKNLGNFFLFLGLLSMGISAAALFMFVPAIIMSIAWGFAIYFLIDKKMTPVKAMALSDKVTDGEKWNIFFIYLVFGLVMSIICGVFAMIPKVGIVFVVVLTLIFMAAGVALSSVMYRHFSEKADALLAEAKPCCHKDPAPAPEAPEAPAPEAPEAPEAPAE